MELKKAIKIVKETNVYHLGYYDLFDELHLFEEAIDTVLNELDNRIPKNKIEKTLNNAKMNVLGVTYVDEEQFEPFNRVLIFVNELEKELLNKE